jgi:hypothetical protein
MNILADLAGSATAIIVIVGAVILVGHLTHLPNFSHEWVLRFLIALAYGGGALLAYSGVGSLWVNDVVNPVAGLFGGLQTGIPHVILTLGSFILILGLVIAMWKAPTAPTVMVAALAPAVLVLTSYGFIHGFWTFTSAPAQHLAAGFATWLGG